MITEMFGMDPGHIDLPPPVTLVKKEKNDRRGKRELED